MHALRTCIGCRQIRQESELFRIVRGSDESLEIGRTLPGRGAWLCAGSVSCIDLASKRKAFTRAFRGHVRQETIESLRAEIAERARIESAMPITVVATE
ncbi:MAG: YlxR family protein [Acidimicrobiales bacterium]